MRSNNVRRPMFIRLLAGKVLAGGLAFAAEAEAQQQGQAGRARPERGAMGRGGRGGPMADPAEMVDARIARLTEGLSLSAGQATAIRGILLEQHEQMAALGPARVAGDPAARGARRQRPDSAARAEGRVRPDSAERERNRAQIAELQQEADARIEAVLSDEQRTAYRELAAKRAEQPKGPPGRGGPGGEGRNRGGQRQAPPPAK